MTEKDKKRILFKDNVLIKTKYELSLVENRLYNLILYKFQKHGNNYKCTISKNEIKEVIKRKDLNTIKGIHSVLDGLSIKRISIEEVKENNKNSLWHNYKLIDGFTYDDEFDTFEIVANARIYDLLKKKFTNGGYAPTNLNMFLNLNNYYGQRFYDLLRMWSGTKNVINYTIDEMKDYLMLTEQYSDYYNFKRRVINPAIKELNNIGCFEVKIKECKVGKSVKSIDFIVKDLDCRNMKNNKSINFSTVNGVMESNRNIEISTIDNVDNNSTITSLTDTLKQSIQGHNVGCIDVEYIETTKVDSDIYNVKQSNKGVSITNGGVNMTYGKSDNKNDDFYVPNTKLFTAKTLNNFKNDFKDYDFRDTKNKEILFKSIMLTLEKDDEDKIKVKSYQYFKTTLNDQLEKINEVKVFVPSVKTRHHNINQTFTKYSDDELEQLLFERQKEKGMLR